MDKDNESSGCFQSLITYILVFLLLPLLFVHIFIDSTVIPKLFNFGSTPQRQETRQETPGSFYCNICNKYVNGYQIREWESENGQGFYIVTEFLDCGHVQTGQ